MAITTSLLFVAALLAADGPSFAEQAVARGHGLVEGRCSSCHAVEATGLSPNPAAPPFRTLGARYPLEDLEESFAEGAFVGHAEMPNFVLSEGDIADLIAYLKALNAPQAKPSK